ncbi:MAG: ABC transporter transmembrane domain-containing protein, partial [Acidimicrobiales bacterium]
MSPRSRRTALEPEELDAPDGHDAAIQVLADGSPPGSHDRERTHRAPTPEETELQDAGALSVLRRGLAVTPELKQGLALTAVLAVATAVGKLAVPVLIQQILDRGVLGDAGYRPGFVAVSCAGVGALIVSLYFVSRATFLRLVRAAEASLLGLRVRAFTHIHRLSMAEHVDHRRGALVSRVTSDIEALAQFTEWGAVAWIVDTILILATLLVMAVYSWQLTLVSIGVFLPLLPILRALQHRQLAAYDDVRARVGDTLSEVSELVTGAPVVLAYGLEERTRRRLARAIHEQYKAQMRAAKWFSIMFPTADLFGAITLATVVSVGA